MSKPKIFRDVDPMTDMTTRVEWLLDMFVTVVDYDNNSNSVSPPDLIYDSYIINNRWNRRDLQEVVQANLIKCTKTVENYWQIWKTEEIKHDCELICFWFIQEKQTYGEKSKETTEQEDRWLPRGHPLLELDHNAILNPYLV